MIDQSLGIKSINFYIRDMYIGMIDKLFKK